MQRHLRSDNVPQLSMRKSCQLLVSTLPSEEILGSVCGVPKRCHCPKYASPSTARFCRPAAFGRQILVRTLLGTARCGGEWKRYAAEFGGDSGGTLDARMMGMIDWDRCEILFKYSLRDAEWWDDRDWDRQGDPLFTLHRRQLPPDESSLYCGNRA
jgi:hypothetical protein